MFKAARLLHAACPGTAAEPCITGNYMCYIWYELVWGTGWYWVRVGKNVGYDLVLGTGRPSVVSNDPVLSNALLLIRTSSVEPALNQHPVLIAGLARV